MSTDTGQRSATIYQFPVGGRRTAKSDSELTNRTREGMRSPRAPMVASGAWYHDAAIQDAKRTGEGR